MPPISRLSVSSPGALGNTPGPAILASIAEIRDSLTTQGLHDEARALHDLIPEVRRTAERARLAEENNRRWRAQWEHASALFALPSSEVSLADKLILWRLRGEALRRREEGIAGPAPILIGDVATERGTIPGLASAVGMSPGQVGKRLKVGAEVCGAIRRTEDKDPATGRTRVLVEFMEAYWHPSRLHREEPRNQGGPGSLSACGAARRSSPPWRGSATGAGSRTTSSPSPRRSRPRTRSRAQPATCPLAPRTTDRAGMRTPQPPAWRTMGIHSGGA